MIQYDAVNGVRILEDTVLTNPQELRNFAGLVRTLVEYAPPAAEMTTPSVSTPTLAFSFDPLIPYSFTYATIVAEPGSLSKEYLTDLDVKLTAYYDSVLSLNY